MDDNNERRHEMAAKIAVLETRTDLISKVVERIENKIDSHTKEEIHNITAFRNDINDILTEFKDCIEEKFDKSVTPLKDDLTKINAGYRAVIWTLTTLGGVIIFFKDHLLRLFS